MLVDIEGDATIAHEVLEQIKKWDKALMNQSIDEMTQHYAENISLFDVSSQLSGLEQYKREWEKVSPYFTANMKITRRDIKIHVLADSAFLYCYSKLENTQLKEIFKMPWCRTTLCLQKKNDTWVLLHQHISVPVNMLTGKAIDLEIKSKLKLVV